MSAGGVAPVQKVVAEFHFCFHCFLPMSLLVVTEFYFYLIVDNIILHFPTFLRILQLFLLALKLLSFKLSL